MDDDAEAEDTHRPHYHFAPARGWMNDPVGLVFFEEEYHLFYQHNPHSPYWGEMHWGHAVSGDLLRWEHLPIALSPNPKLGFVFSGSAVVDRQDTAGLGDGRPCLLAIFTHAFGDDGAQKQSLAWSVDRGRTWTEYPGNPVLPNPGIPDFRDPKVFWHAETGRWIMAVAGGDKASFYGSLDLKRWTHLSDFGPISGFPEGAWECPDLFRLPVEGRDETRWVLKVDVNPGLGLSGAFRCFIGTFDGTRFSSEGPDGGLRPDWGNDFYAAQSFSDVDDGRRIWVAWRDSWLYALCTPTQRWRGALTIPRELSLVSTPGGGLTLAQLPVRELCGLRDGCLVRLEGDVSVADASSEVEGLSADSLDIVVELHPMSAREVGLCVLVGRDERTVVGYDAERGALFVDRTRSGDVSFHPAFAERCFAPVALDDGLLRLRILVDRSSVEVFAQEGRTVISSGVFPSPASRGLGLYAEGGAPRIRLLEVHRLARCMGPPR